MNRISAEIFSIVYQQIACISFGSAGTFRIERELNENLLCSPENASGKTATYKIDLKLADARLFSGELAQIAHILDFGCLFFSRN